MKNNHWYLNLLLIGLTTACLCFWPNASVGQDPVDMYKVIVDPGHGGQDTGSKGSDGLLEKDVTMALAKKLVQTLEETGEFSTELTRADAQAVSRHSTDSTLGY